MNNKLEQGAESFKQFVLDEYNQLFDKYQEGEKEVATLKENYKVLRFANEQVRDKYFALQKHYQTDLAKLGKAEEHATMNVHLQKRLEAMQTSYNTIVRERNAQEEQIKKITGELDSAKNIQHDVKVKVGTIDNLKKDLAKAEEINKQLISFLDKLGYKVTVKTVDEIIKSGDMRYNKAYADKFIDFLKKGLSDKYHVEEVIEKPMPTFDDIWNQIMNSKPTTDTLTSRESNGRFKKK